MSAPDIMSERNMEQGHMDDERDDPKASPMDPVTAAIVHSVIICGILAVHFGFVPLW